MAIWEDHPLGMIRETANAALGDLTGEFAKLEGPRRLSIPPERLLRAMLLQSFYGIRSERQLMDRMEIDLLFRWFVGLGTGDATWDHSTFATNRNRLLTEAIVRKFLVVLIADPHVKRLLATDHFAVDGTLLMAWVSGKNVRHA
jgi:transposase